MKKKQVTIRNDTFTYILLIVPNNEKDHKDNRVIAFKGSDNAKWFEDHFRALGYKVIVEDHSEVIR